MHKRTTDAILEFESQLRLLGTNEIDEPEPEPYTVAANSTSAEHLLGTKEIDEPEPEHLQVVPDYTTRPLSYLAAEAETDWSMRGQGVSPYARPYLTAMGTLSTMEDRYGADTAMEVVMYFLSNARGWRGEVAKRIKKELNARIAECCRCPWVAGVKTPKE